MPDILSQGRDHEPGSRRWRTLAVVAVLVVAAAVVVGLRLPSTGHAHHHRAAAASRSSSGPTVVSLPSEPDGIAGPTRPWPASVRLPVTGSQPAWYWPAHRPQAARGRPAQGDCRLRVHPRRRRLGDPARVGVRSELRQLRLPSVARLFPRRPGVLGRGGRRGRRGGPGRRAGPAMADQLPARRQPGHRGRDRAGGQPVRGQDRPAAQAAARLRHRPGDQPRPAAGARGHRARDHHRPAVEPARSAGGPHLPQRDRHWPERHRLGPALRHRAAGPGC